MPHFIEAVYRLALSMKANTERNAEIIHLWVSGLTQEAIGKRVGLDRRTVSAIITRERAKMKIGDRQSLVEREVAFLDEVRGMAMEIADQAPAPVTAGKDGDVVRDPATGEVVRDHAGRLAGMKEARETSRDLRKLLGLDQPTQSVVTETVRYEVVGLSDEDLE